MDMGPVPPVEIGFPSTTRQLWPVPGAYNWIGFGKHFSPGKPALVILLVAYHCMTDYSKISSYIRHLLYLVVSMGQEFGSSLAGRLTHMAGKLGSGNLQEAYILIT